MAQAGQFPGVAARLTRRAGTPAVATALQIGVALVLLWTGTQESIIVYAGVGLSIFSMLAMSSIYVLRWRRPDLPRPFRTPGYPVTPAVYLFLTGLLTLATFHDRPEVSCYALAEHPGGNSVLLPLARQAAGCLTHCGRISKLIWRGSGEDRLTSRTRPDLLEPVQITATEPTSSQRALPTVHDQSSEPYLSQPTTWTSAIPATLPDLPPVEPPSAGFVVQLFVIPAVVVVVVIIVWLLFGKLAGGERDAMEYVRQLRSPAANWRLRFRAGQPDPARPQDRQRSGLARRTDGPALSRARPARRRSQADPVRRPDAGGLQDARGQDRERPERRPAGPAGACPRSEVSDAAFESPPPPAWPSRRPA